MTTISTLSTIYVSVPVSTLNADITQLPGWPFTVSIACIGPYATIPEAAENPPTASTTWYPAAWNGTNARILVGPAGGAVALSPGAYQLYVRLECADQDVWLWSGPLIVV